MFDMPPAVVITVEQSVSSDEQRLRRAMMSARGGALAGKQLRCAMSIAYKESRYNPDARNKSSGAQGAFQLMHGKKHWTLDKQIQMATKYMKHRYKTWCNAWKHHKLRGWW